MEADQLTKKEKRELAKQQKKDAQKKEAVADRSKRGFLWLIGLVIFAFVGWQIYNFFATPLPEQAVEPIAVAESDLTKGNPDAQMVLIEFSDFQCPACKAYYPLVNQLGEEMGDEVLIVYRHYPLTQIHPNATPAALASQAASKQDKFWEMHDLLFDRQEEWSGVNNAEELFISYAEELELNIDQFRQDLSSREARDKVNADLISGNQLGVNATPTFFLNGRKLDGIRSYQDFVSAIENAQTQ